jgi:hypothetical protein
VYWEIDSMTMKIDEVWVKKKIVLSIELGGF